MPLWRQHLLPKLFSHHTLLALCASILLYRIWTSHDPPVQLRETLPPDGNGIPRILWYGLGSYHNRNELDSATREWVNSCTDDNSDHQVWFVIDGYGAHYVLWQSEIARKRPDIAEYYLGLKVPAVQADLLRYLKLFDNGGIWFDLGTSCEGIPIDDWIPPQYKEVAGLVVGWEFDVGREQGFPRQFASWTMMAKPESPHLLQVIDDILQALQDKMDQYNVSIENITLDMIGDVVDFSGARRLTNSVFKSFGKSLNRTVEVDEVSELIHPKLVGDVLVMPGRSWAASANRYKTEDEEKFPPKLVSYHYAVS